MTESLEGTHSSARVEWNYDEDLVTITFDSRETTEEELERGIGALGYQVERPSATGEGLAVPVPSETFSLPEDAPAFFREAVERAKVAGKPLLVDFWAPWCAPCLKLRRETLDSPALAALLERFEVIAVDLDETPALGKFYRVSSIPYVLFVDPNGNVVDRLLGFELTTLLEMRLKKALP